jgi:hypothetical protein
MKVFSNTTGNFPWAQSLQVDETFVRQGVKNMGILVSLSTDGTGKI